MDFYTSTDEEKAEAIQAWLRKNIKWLLLGLCIFGVGFASFWYWQQIKIQNRFTAADHYEKVLALYEKKDETGLLLQLKQLQGQFPSNIYTSLASLFAAKFDREHAAEHFNFVIEHATSDELVAIAKIRLAKLEFDANKPQVALSILDTVKGDLYKSYAHGIKGDILFESSPMEAKNNYLMAIALSRGDAGNRVAHINKKLHQLNGILDEAEAISKQE